MVGAAHAVMGRGGERGGVGGVGGEERRGKGRGEGTWSYEHVYKCDRTRVVMKHLE